jgi:hypothetical protein
MSSLIVLAAFLHQDFSQLFVIHDIQIDGLTTEKLSVSGIT